jgi:acyl-coenzyme A synthetase/AMP-(fatty) acid ligase
LNRIVVFLGMLKAGVVFVLLDPEHPVPALRNVTEHAEAKAAIVDSEAMASIAEELGLKPIFAPLPWPDRQAVEQFCRIDPPADQPVYIRYTSGSTGRPKGVAYSWPLTNAACDRMDILTPTQAGERAALLRQFWPIHALAVLRAGAMLDFFDLPGRGGQAMLHWLRERSINQIRSFTAVFRAMQVERSVVLPDLRYATFAGEALLRADAEYFDAICTPGARLVNFFSATEHQAVSYSVHEHGAPIRYDSLPLGVPTEPGEIWVVDENGNPVSDGVEGEFVITSPYIPTGYYKEQEQTAQRFRPFPPLDGRLAYYTGDRGMVGLDGLLHTAGRADDQIKIRGYALRPSEIEQVVLDHPGIDRVADLPWRVAAGIHGAHGLPGARVFPDHGYGESAAPSASRPVERDCRQSAWPGGRSYQGGARSRAYLDRDAGPRRFQRGGRFFRRGRRFPPGHGDACCAGKPFSGTRAIGDANS